MCDVILTHLIFKFVFLLLLIMKFQNSCQILLLHVSHLSCNVTHVFRYCVLFLEIFHAFAVSKTCISDINQLFMINIFVIIMTRSKRRWERSSRCHVSLVNAIFSLSSEHFLGHEGCKSVVS